ncbi:DUF2971 domain-containing protein [Geodermatophilus obscurus]|uniref:DUF2971 domain-containing protein n=1 Tax=Geodermatophilus obscurus (strain ATCC 25078 / DSM 43160 / JCM 3152 / CCUG 61914 / KCC A-0152 / KCTC 9177 / NBRC 13315 / NRRL B-3577 / G-20) TaxID=526225 RepID=D2SBI0_GEOOG|nr:DUF2971 domain-containing protein [Geodermatophilus obscurus]ADB76087.1 conserved hypothetical protein [Geodermatophilus obscurus DSM 43160]
MTDLPRGLCHYTSGQGLLGIVQAREIWATHILYLNDHTEYQSVYDDAKSLLERITVLRELSHEAPRLRDAILSNLGPITRGRPAGVFVASLSENWDDLSQWRGYTQPGDGYGVVFDPEVLRAHAVSEGWTLEKCLYGSRSVSTLVSIIRETFTRYIGGGWTHDEAGATSAVMDLSQKILPIAPLVKHEAFAAENEWRLISPPLYYKNERLEFRPGRSFLVPYLRFKYADPGERAIMHVSVGPGPNADLAVQAVLAVIGQNGLNCGCGATGAPYRPW